VGVEEREVADRSGEAAGVLDPGRESGDARDEVIAEDEGKAAHCRHPGRWCHGG
jgi:hypothetical protein